MAVVEGRKALVLVLLLPLEQLLVVPIVLLLLLELVLLLHVHDVALDFVEARGQVLNNLGGFCGPVEDGAVVGRHQDHEVEFGVHRQVVATVDRELDSLKALVLTAVSREVVELEFIRSCFAQTAHEDLLSPVELPYDVGGVLLPLGLIHGEREALVVQNTPI